VIPSVIAGASTPEQVRQNAEAVARVLSADEISAVEKIADNAPHRFWVH